MARLGALIIALILSFGIVSSAESQVPHLQIYFNFDTTGETASCPPDPSGTVIDSLYIVAEDFNAYISAIEYRVDYPPEILWLIDDTNGIDIGNSTSGIATAWPRPRNAFSPVIVNRVIFIWMCQGCSKCNIPLCANVHSDTGYLRAVRWPDLEFIYATTGAACICVCGPPFCICPNPPVPTEATSWGKIKAIYR